jgi:hypothetical protein
MMVAKEHEETSPLGMKKKKSNIKKYIKRRNK